MHQREEELRKGWAEWEAKFRAEMTKAVDERLAWVQRATEDIEVERRRLDGVKRELEHKMQQLELAESQRKMAYEMKAKTPLEEVKNILAPLAKLAESTDQTPVRPAKSSKGPVFETPESLVSTVKGDPPVSAMKGVILTNTGEALPTPSPAEFAKLFMATPKVSLNFAQIFDFESDTEDGPGDIGGEDGYETDTRPSSTSTRSSKHDDDDHDDVECTPTQAVPVRPTRLRRPSIRTSSGRPSLERAATLPAPSAITPSSSSAAARAKSKSRSRQPSPAPAPRIVRRPVQPPRVNKDGMPEYDLSDEENLPSPFLKKVERERVSRTVSVPASSSHAPSTTTAHSSNSSASTGVTRAPRKSGGSMLRALAVTNAANAANLTKGSSTTGTSKTIVRSQSTTNVRSSLAKAQKASEEARRALFRP